MWPTADTLAARWVLGRLVQPVLVVLIGAGAIIAVQAATVEPAAAQGCGNIPLVSDVCDLATDPFEWAWDTATGIGGELIEGAFDYFASWMATSALGVLDMLADAIETTTTPNVAGADTTHGISLAIARALALPLLVMTGLWALVKREAQLMVKAALLYLPGTVIGMYASIWLTDQLLAATDGFSEAYGAAGDDGIRAFADTVAGQITAGAGITSPGLLVIFSVVLVFASVMVWMVMLIRAAAILVAYAFMPIAFAGLLFPATRSWIKRLVEVQLSFILSKLVIVAVFALGAEVLTSADNALAGMLQASALFLLASFSPFAIMKIIPFATSEAMAALERPASTPSRIATGAAATAGGFMLYRHLGGSQQSTSGAASSAGAGGATGAGGTGSVPGGSGGGAAASAGAGAATAGATVAAQTAAKGVSRATQTASRTAEAATGTAAPGRTTEPER